MKHCLIYCFIYIHIFFFGPTAVSCYDPFPIVWPLYLPASPFVFHLGNKDIFYLKDHINVRVSQTSWETLFPFAFDALTATFKGRVLHEICRHLAPRASVRMAIGHWLTLRIFYCISFRFYVFFSLGAHRRQCHGNL